MSEKIQVWLEKRRTGAHKCCPQCQCRNRAAAKTCKSCGTSLTSTKRSYDGKKPSYLLRWIDTKTGKEEYKSVGSDKSYAQHLQGQIREQLTQGQQVGLNTITFDAFVTEHLDHIQKTLSNESYKQHERVLRFFKDICHPRNLKVIDFQMVETYRSKRLDAGVTAASVNKDLRTLQGILERAVKRRYIHSNVFKGNRKALYVPEPENEISTLTQKEFEKIIAICPDDRWKGIISVGYYAGLRQNEITALEWGDIDFDNRLLHIKNSEHHTTKSRKVRLVPMAMEVVTALKKLEHNRFKSKFVFTSKRLKGEKMTNNISRDFETLVVKSGLIDDNGDAQYTMHNLRATFVSDMLSTGTDVKSVQMMCGHGSSQTTLKYYAAVRAKQMQEAVDRRGRKGTAG